MLELLLLQGDERAGISGAQDPAILDKDVKHLQGLLKKTNAARQALRTKNREARRKANEVSFLTQRLKLKKKEIKLTKQKLNALAEKLKKYDSGFEKLRTLLQNEF